MKRLLEYILESDNIDNLKKRIIDHIQNSSNEKILKKVNKILKLSNRNPENNLENRVDIKKYFMDRCGFTEKISTTLIQKIHYYDCYELFEYIFYNIINDDTIKNDKVLTGDLLRHNSNIYKLIIDYVKSIIDNDEEIKNDFDEEDFKDLLKNIAEFTLGGKVATGAFEFLSVMFLKDLNPKNSKGSDQKVVCDINTEQYAFEYKADGARIAGNKEESKPLSPKVIDETFIELITEEFDKFKETDTQKNKNQASVTIRYNNNSDNDLDQALKDNDVFSFISKLSERNNLFRNGDENNKNNKGIKLSSVLEPLIEFGLNEDKLNNIVLTSFLSQVPNVKCNDSSRKYLLKKYPIIENKKANNSNLRRIFLILGLCNYWLAERWNYLILFEDAKKGTGNYHVIEEPNENNMIESIDKEIEKRAYSGANPCYGNGTTDQNYAPMIKYINN